MNTEIQKGKLRKIIDIEKKIILIKNLRSGYYFITPLSEEKARKAFPSYLYKIC